MGKVHTLPILHSVVTCSVLYPTWAKTIVNLKRNLAWWAWISAKDLKRCQEWPNSTLNPPYVRCCAISNHRSYAVITTVNNVMPQCDASLYWWCSWSSLCMCVCEGRYGGFVRLVRYCQTVGCADCFADDQRRLWTSRCQHGDLRPLGWVILHVYR